MELKKMGFIFHLFAGKFGSCLCVTSDVQAYIIKFHQEQIPAGLIHTIFCCFQLKMPVEQLMDNFHAYVDTISKGRTKPLGEDFWLLSDSNAYLKDTGWENFLKNGGGGGGGQGCPRL